MFDPLLSAPPVIQIHVLGAVLSLLLGPVTLYRSRRDHLHKVLGYVWVTAMAVTALSSFLIHDFALVGPFSPIHLLSLLALASLFVAVRAAIRGNTTLHRETMHGLYWRGLTIAGLFTFLPGRLVNRVFFGADPELGWVVICIGAAWMVSDIVRKHFERRAARSAALRQA